MSIFWVVRPYVQHHLRKYCVQKMLCKKGHLILIREGFSSSKPDILTQETLYHAKTPYSNGNQQTNNPIFQKFNH